MGLNYSDVESKRFGMRIYRGQYADFNEQEIERIVNEGNFDIIIVRYPTSTIYEHYRLVDFKNCKTIHADSLVYYSASLQEIDIKPLRNDILFEVIAPDDSEQLDDIIETIFSGYQNHYYANPCLSRPSIIEGYMEWAKSYIREESGRIAWFAKDRFSGKTIAFATCYNDAKGNSCEGILYGVMPECSGKGVYADLIRFTQSYYKGLGVETMMVSTQLQNVKVQRVWQSHGFKLLKSFETYHIVNNTVWEKKQIKNKANNGL